MARLSRLAPPYKRATLLGYHARRMTRPSSSWPYELQIGWRYTRAGRAGRRNGFISFISGVSMLGIALGVAALIIVLSVMNGFQKEVRDRMLSVIPHVEKIRLLVRCQARENAREVQPRREALRRLGAKVADLCGKGDELLALKSLLDVDTLIVRGTDELLVLVERRRPPAVGDASA